MCFWDLKHGRRRIVKLTTATAGTITIAPDARRVAIMFGVNDSLGGGGVYASISSNVQGTPVVLFCLTIGKTTEQLDIERHGNLVVAGFTMLNIGASNLTVIEVYTNEEERDMA